jgi:hypothetical protein
MRLILYEIDGKTKHKYPINQQRFSTFLQQRQVKYDSMRHFYPNQKHEATRNHGCNVFSIQSYNNGDLQ